MSALIISHANCNDGFSAALIAKTFLQSISTTEVKFMNYGEEAPNVRGKDVYILDFSFPRETLIKMNEEANNLKVIDHHKTAEKNCKGLDFCTFDTSKCGAVLTWEHFYPDIPIPDFLLYIQDRDLWKWEMDGSKDFHAGLETEERKFETWSDYLYNNNFYRLFTIGETINIYKEKLVRSTVKGHEKAPRYCKLDGRVGPIINTNHIISEKLHELCKYHDFACAYFDLSNGKTVYSLRSDENGADVAEISSAYGGGGHKHAAGFTMNELWKPEIVIKGS